MQVTDMIGKLRSSKSLQTFSRSFIAQAHHSFESCRVTSRLKVWSLDGCLYSRQGNGSWRRINCQIFILQQLSKNLVGIWISKNLELLARVRVLN